MGLRFPNSGIGTITGGRSVSSHQIPPPTDVPVDLTALDELYTEATVV